jgi:hypothetical protein
MHPFSPLLLLLAPKEDRSTFDFFTYGTVQDQVTLSKQRCEELEVQLGLSNSEIVRLQNHLNILEEQMQVSHCYKIHFNISPSLCSIPYNLFTGVVAGGFGRAGRKQLYKRTTN